MIVVNRALAKKLMDMKVWLREGITLDGVGFLGFGADIRSGVTGFNAMAYSSNVCVSSYTAINAGTYKNCSIGSYCSFAEGVRILGQHDYSMITTSMCTVNWHDQTTVFDNFKGNKIEYGYAHTHIGHDVWLGANVMIKNGLFIGHGAVIGAGAVVTKHVPPFAIVGGTPAKIIKMRFPDHIIERLIKSEWYTYDWANVELDWPNLENCLSKMEDCIATNSVPRLTKGYQYNAEKPESFALTPASWSFEQQIKSDYKTSDILELFELPEIKEHVVH